MNTFLLDSSKTVTKIKEHVYSFLDISVGIGHQKKNFTSASLVISGCKQNLDDLKRIESLLKGYMNSKKEALNDAPELYQTDKASLYTSTSPTDLKGISGNENINYIQ